jgi:hypothetical protein
MNNLTYIRRLQKLHLRIKGANTGSPKVLANQFGISERSLYCLLDILRDMNAKIYYSRKRKTYYYKDDDFDIDIDIKIKLIHKGVAKNIYGGWALFKNNSFTARKLQWTNLT